MLSVTAFVLPLPKKSCLKELFMVQKPHETRSKRGGRSCMSTRWKKKISIYLFFVHCSFILNVSCTSFFWCWMWWDDVISFCLTRMNCGEGDGEVTHLGSTIWKGIRNHIIDWSYWKKDNCIFSTPGPTILKNDLVLNQVQKVDDTLFRYSSTVKYSF